MNIGTLLSQPAFPDLCPVTDAVRSLAAAGQEERGAIFTRREVVDFMLDLVGYVPSEPLHRRRALEPSFGGGDFLLPMIGRLLAAWSRHNGTISELAGALRAVELHALSYTETRAEVAATLVAAGLDSPAAAKVTDAWLVHGDFLLADIDGQFDYVIGNPPYIRQEMIADALMAEYRRRYRTVYDRADIYIPFIERSLGLLATGGQLSFICADRWMKNRYGGPLRAMVAKDFHLAAYIDMVDTPAFHSDVIAYPAITVIARAGGSVTRMAYRPEIEAGALTALAAAIRSDASASQMDGVHEAVSVAAGSEPWILEGADRIALLRRLEADFPLIEEAGCKVGIGVASGADKAFIGPFDALDVEDDRKLPIAMTRDIDSGVVSWRGLGIVNPFGDDGKLVRLEDYPRLKRHLEARYDEIAGRHVARKAPANWYRTIDRIYPELAAREKLLIPDIKGEALIVHEDGRLYPHHNLYFIIADEWDLHALQAVLKSGIARLFVAAYSTKMRGGFLRFQAQYLRRIRLPRWHDIAEGTRAALVAAARAGDMDKARGLVFDIYELSATERTRIEGA